MPDKEFKSETITPVPRPPPISPKTPKLEHLLSMTSEQLIKMLLSPDMAKSENHVLRQQIITILQERKGNAFVQSLLGGKTSSEK